MNIKIQENIFFQTVVMQMCCKRLSGLDFMRITVFDIRQIVAIP
jgi:hypothetical protein